MTRLNLLQEKAFQEIAISREGAVARQYLADQLAILDKNNRTAAPSPFTAGQASFCADLIQLLTTTKGK